jgi:hypothetical protein
MADIQDSGKIWCKGSTSPVHAVRARNKIFATGKKENQAIECWLDGEALCVDLHDAGTRIARKFPLNIEPTLSGTLFNGFTSTKHADVTIVSSDQNGVEEKIVTGEIYRTGEYESMNSRDFWDKIWAH